MSSTSASELVGADQLVRLTVTAKLPDNVHLGRFAQLTDAVNDYCLGGSWAPYAHAWGFGAADYRQLARVVRARYGSDYMLVLSVAGSVAVVLLTLSSVIKNLAAARLDFAHARKIEAETDMLEVSEGLSMDEKEGLRAARLTAAVLVEEDLPVTALIVRVAFNDPAVDESEVPPGPGNNYVGPHGVETTKDRTLAEARRLIGAINVLAELGVTFVVGEDDEPGGAEPSA